MMAFHEALLAMGKESPMGEWLERRNQADAPPERKITTQVNIVGWMDRRDAALRAHATQIDPDGWFFAIPNEVQAQTWPTDDFELARSLVDTELPEDDLFAGIRDRAKV